MNEIIFNPLGFKSPSGAITNKDTSVFNILIRNDYYIEGIEFFIFSDLDIDNKMIKKMEFVEKVGSYNKFSVNIEPLQVGIYYYYFELIFSDSRKFVSSHNLDAVISDNLTTWQLTVYDSDYSTPDWVKGGIMYQIFPDRYSRNMNFKPDIPVNSDERIIHDNWNDIPQSSLDTENYSAKDFFMGNLDGILDKKEYLKELKIDMIYLNPIFESSENHRYSTADYYKIDPYLGTNDGFKNMCEKLKNDNIKIILDGVFSHTGSDSIYFNKYSRYDEIGAFNSIESRYYPWFKFINYPNNYESWWGFDNLPTLFKENEDYMNYICNHETGVLNYWQNLGISGWRLDVVDELPDCFVDKLRISVKSKDPEAFIIGEVWEDASNKHSYGYRRKYLLGEQLDSVMNYPWKNAIIDFMKNKNSTLFSGRINSLLNNYPTPSIDTLMNILSTHDTERIITVLGTNVYTIDHTEKKDFRLTSKEYEKAKSLLKVASFLQFTLPGIPSIYYGDEIGMQGFADPFNRCSFNIENADLDILEHYKKLTIFRNSYKDDFKTGFELGFAEGNVYGYYRNNIFCLVNLCNDPIIFENIINGEWVFGEKRPFFTGYGTVFAPNSYTAIKIERR